MTILIQKNLQKIFSNLLDSFEKVESKDYPLYRDVGLHPGTVDSPLTQPFQKNLEDSKIFSADFSVLKLSSVIDSLSVESSGKCIDWEGKVVSL